MNSNTTIFHHLFLLWLEGYLVERCLILAQESKRRHTRLLPEDTTSSSILERYLGQQYGLLFIYVLVFCTLLTRIFQWPSIETHTTSPYTLSLKSNGCIIFIAALTPTKLLITSKHSLGPVAGTDTSHAQAGEGWLRKYLVEKGKTEAELATRLWESNLTAIAEVISKTTSFFEFTQSFF